MACGSACTVSLTAWPSCRRSAGSGSGQQTGHSGFGWMVVGVGIGVADEFQRLLGYVGFQQAGGGQTGGRRIVGQQDVQFLLVFDDQYGDDFRFRFGRQADDYGRLGVAGRHLAYLVGIQQAGQSGIRSLRPVADVHIPSGAGGRFVIGVAGRAAGAGGLGQ